MSPLFSKAATLPFLALLCAPAFAFQNAALDGPVTIVPRARPILAEAAEEAPPAAHLRVDSALVLIPVHVSTQLGTPVTNLTKDNFRLLEESVEQPISYFIKEDAPISVGVLVDMSGSMHDKIRKSAEAAAKFFHTANAEDEFFLVEFCDRARLAVPFPNDPDEIYRHIPRARPLGRTALYDAVHLALAPMKNPRHERKALLITSAGARNPTRTA